MRCFIHQEKDCFDECMAFCGKEGNPMCAIVDGIAMMGAVSAQALKVAITPTTKHPQSAPPPKVTP